MSQKSIFPVLGCLGLLVLLGACITMPEFIPTRITGYLDLGDGGRQPFTLEVQEVQPIGMDASVSDASALDAFADASAPDASAPDAFADASAPDAFADASAPDASAPDSGPVVGVLCPTPDPIVSTYYCPTGNDSNPGTMSQPKAGLARLIADVQAASVTSAFYMCRGGQWTGALRLRVPYDVNRRIIVSAYGPEDQPAPILVNNASEPALNLAPGSNGPVYGGVYVSDLDIRGQGQAAGALTFRLQREIHLCNLDISGHLTGIQFSHTVPGSSDFSLKHSRIHDNAAHGFLGGGDGLEIHGNNFQRNGRANMLDHNIYVTAGDNIRVTGNYSTLSAVGPSGTACFGAAAVFHGGLQSNVLIADNVFEEPNASQGCWGIGLDDSSAGAQGATGVTIRNNTFRNMGNVAIALQSCQDCAVLDNTIESNAGFMTIGVAAPSRTPYNPGSSVPLTRLQVSGNKVTLASGKCFLLDPNVILDSDSNTCVADSFASDTVQDLVLEAWQSQTGFDQASTWSTP